MKFGGAIQQVLMMMPAKFGDPRPRGLRVLAHSLVLHPLRSPLSQSEKLLTVWTGRGAGIILGLRMIFGTEIHSVGH